MPELVLGFRATEATTNGRHGDEVPDLHGLPLDDAGRPARPRGDAALLHDEVRQRGEPQPPLRLGRPRRRWTTRASASRSSSARKDTKEIVFTSGATESDNLAIKGVAEFYKDKGNHIVTTVIEHKAVLDTCKRLEKEGYEVTYLGVGKDGLVDPDDVKKAITDKTILVSVMLANNEIGTVQPLEEIGKITRERGVLLHSDAVQGVGKVDFDVQRMNVDLASITAHKMYGPKGIGALYVRRSKPRVRLVAQMDGGGHERGMRSGTLPVPLIVGLRQGVPRSCTREGKAESAKLCRRFASACASGS